MGRKRRKAAVALDAQAAVNSPNETGGVIEQTLALPRWGRLLLVALFSIAAALLATPIIDNVYVTYFFDMETRMLPSFVSTAFGFMVYAIGWWLIIGRVGEVPPPRKTALVYVLLGLGALATVLILILVGVYSNVLTKG
jgi:hypothetical protein